MTIIRLKKVNKSFGKVAAVADLDLEVDAGEFVSLLGPSGCGKTTTLRCIAGLERPDAGEIWINDRMVSSAEKAVWLTPRDRDLSMVFQTYAVWPHMNVFENVAFGLKTRRIPKREIKERVNETLGLVGIGELKKRYPYELSGGQQQRVALARALVVKPSVLLMDEPLSNLDARLRMLMRDELKRIHHKLGATIVYVTHDQVEALALSSKIVVMKEGIVQQIADPLTLYEYPGNLFVAQFVGSLAINLIEVQIVQVEESSLELVTSDGVIHLPITRPKGVDRKGKVVIGIRPEAITFEQVLTAEGKAEAFRVTGVQFNGSLVVLRAQSAATELTIQAPGSTGAELRYGDFIRPVIDVRKIRFYNPADGTLLTAISAV